MNKFKSPQYKQYIQYKLFTDILKKSNIKWNGRWGGD